MPSGKRQLRSASSDSRNSASPMAGGTYIKKETPGGLQSNLKTQFRKSTDKKPLKTFQFQSQMFGPQTIEKMAEM